MRDKFYCTLQSLLPQHLLSRWMGQLAEIKNPRIKNFLINQFIKKYHIDLSEAVIENAADFPTFNDFFIRQLKPHTRPIAADATAIACPVDGTIAQIGNIQHNQLLQAKNHYFDIESLCGGDKQVAASFYNGEFATLYLAPYNYHRVHMPITGKLLKTIYVPGKLFSVNKITSEYVPHLYSRNERLITIFSTAAGTMAVILVGAMIVGSIQTVWQPHPLRSHTLMTETFTNDMVLQKGDELGHFKLGSTVILLFAPKQISWSSTQKAMGSVKYGQYLGEIHNSLII